MNRKQIAEINLRRNGFSMNEFHTEPFKFGVSVANDTLTNEQRHNLLDRGYTIDTLDDDVVYWFSPDEFTLETEDDRIARIEQATQWNIERLQYLERGGSHEVREDYEYLKSLSTQQSTKE